MSLERVRFVGGALQGQAMWVEPGCATLNVHIGGQSAGATKTLHYRRSGGTLRYLGETQTAPTQREGIEPRESTKAAILQ